MRSLTIDAVFDIETEAWDKFVLGGLLTREGYREYRDPLALADAILEIRGNVWAHNGGRYDALWLAEILRRRGVRVQISLAGSRVTRMQIGGTVVRDSFALVPMSLAKAAPIAGARKTSPGFPCRCGEDCGGYCSIRRDMSAADFAKLGEYLENDCRVTLAVLDAVAAFAERRGFALCGTVGGTAWNGVRLSAGIPNAEWSDAGTYKLARRGYYGGRVTVFRPRSDCGYRYDIHSSYPAALVRTPVPFGTPELVTGPRASGAYAAGAEGIFAAKVAVHRDTWIPPLPVRGAGRLWFPVGEVSGVWTALELRHAESVGACVLSVDYGLVWPESSRILAGWCESVWSWRAEAEAEGDGALARWIKWIANSLTGKVAMRPSLRLAMISPDSPKACNGIYTPCDGRNHPIGRCCPHRCIGKCGSWEPIGPRVWSREIFKIPSCGHVQAGAYLTASARVELHLQLLHAGEAAIYCDTDSVYSTRELTRRIGADLGEWGAEGEMRDWFALAPKLYRYRAVGAERSPAAGAEWQVKAKGIPKARVGDLDILASGGVVSRPGGVHGFRSAARSGGDLFAARVVKRGSRLDGVHVGDRVIRGDITFPLDAVNIPG